MKDPLIFITNDDGIDSPGLLAVADAVKDIGDIVIVAPERQQTAMGRSLWHAKDAMLKPIDLHIQAKSVSSYRCDSSPARCVLHAFDVLFANRKPDLVISGINYGENMGTNVGMSGTVGAAMQAAALGTPAISIAQQTDISHHYIHAKRDWSTAKYFTTLFAQKVLNTTLPHDVAVINVNVPDNATFDTAWRITRQSHQPYFSNHLENPTISSQIKDAKCTIDLDLKQLEEDSDIYAIIKDHVVSVTPLSLDLTAQTDSNWSL